GPRFAGSAAHDNGRAAAGGRPPVQEPVHPPLPREEQEPFDVPSCDGTFDGLVDLFREVHRSFDVAVLVDGRGAGPLHLVEVSQVGRDADRGHDSPSPSWISPWAPAETAGARGSRTPSPAPLTRRRGPPGRPRTPCAAPPPSAAAAVLFPGVSRS